MFEVKQVSNKAHTLVYKQEKEDANPRLMDKGLIYPTTTLTGHCLLSKNGKMMRQERHLEKLFIPGLA